MFLCQDPNTDAKSDGGMVRQSMATAPPRAQVQMETSTCVWMPPHPQQGTEAWLDPCPVLLVLQIPLG